MFQVNVERKGLTKAKAIYFSEVLKLFRPELIELFNSSQKLKLTNMTTHHFRIAIRRLFRNGKSSVVSISGISIGLIATFLMLFYIQYETTYDSFHEKHDRLYMVERIHQNSRVSEIYDSNPYPLARELEKNIPEIEIATNISRTANYFNYNDQLFYENNGLYADQKFLEAFSFNFIEGNQKQSLTDPLSIVISESLSKKVDPYGKVIGKKIRINKQHDFLITGVFEDYPENSHLNVDYILSFESYKIINQIDPTNNWNSGFSSTYISLNKSVSPLDVDLKIKNFMKSYAKKDSGYEEFLLLRRIGDIYLHSSKVKGGVGKRSEITIIYMFYGVVIFTIIITALNYINSTTAQTMSRELELGIKKVMGSSPYDLGLQFFAESTVLLFVSLFIATILSFSLMPLFGEAVDRELQFVMERDWVFLAKIVGGTLLVGTIAGLYPVIYLSRLKISSFLNGLSSLNRKTTLRKFLVVFQLLVSIPLIFTAIIISEQITYLQTRNLGFDKDNLLRTSVTTGEINEEKIDFIKSQLLQRTDIIDCTFSWSAPFNSARSMDVSIPEENSKERFRLRTHQVDYDFIDTYRMTLVEGRDFSKDYSSDLENGIIINETTRGLFGWKSAVGKTFNNGDLIVIGVVKDFNDYTLFKKIRPMALTLRNADSKKMFVSIRINGNDHYETQKYVNNLFNEEFQEEPIQFSYLENNFDVGFLASLQNVNKMFIFFSFLAVMMTGIGLYSLVALSARMQQKMIAIRKVLGAGVKDLFLIMLKEYLFLYGIAAIIGLVASYHLSIYAFNVLPYHTSIKPVYLVISGAIALGVVLVSVIQKIATTVKANPVDSISRE